MTGEFLLWLSLILSILSVIGIWTIAMTMFVLISRVNLFMEQEARWTDENTR